jgi:hypothetical protein
VCADSQAEKEYAEAAIDFGFNFGVGRREDSELLEWLERTQKRNKTEEAPPDDSLSTATSASLSLTTAATGNQRDALDSVVPQEPTESRPDVTAAGQAAAAAPAIGSTAELCVGSAVWLKEDPSAHGTVIGTANGYWVVRLGAGSTKKFRYGDLQWSYEERLAMLMSEANRGANVSNAPLRTWERCNFRTIYDACGKPRSCLGVWSDPINTVAQSFPECFHVDKWREALERTKPAAINRGTRASSGQESDAMAQLLMHAGAACAHLWTAGWMFTLVNKVRLDLFYEGTLSERLYS